MTFLIPIFEGKAGQVSILFMVFLALTALILLGLAVYKDRKLTKRLSETWRWAASVGWFFCISVPACLALIVLIEVCFYGLTLLRFFAFAINSACAIFFAMKNAETIHPDKEA